jgi:hypothetical protein
LDVDEKQRAGRGRGHYWSPIIAVRNPKTLIRHPAMAHSSPWHGMSH